MSSSDSEKVTQYIEKHTKWSALLSEIREVLKTTPLLEEVKWGAPSYSFNNKILIGLGSQYTELLFLNLKKPSKTVKLAKK